MKESNESPDVVQAHYSALRGHCLAKGGTCDLCGICDPCRMPPNHITDDVAQGIIDCIEPERTPKEREIILTHYRQYCEYCERRARNHGHTPNAACKRCAMRMMCFGKRMHITHDMVEQVKCYLLEG